MTRPTIMIVQHWPLKAKIPKGCEDLGTGDDHHSAYSRPIRRRDMEAQDGLPRNHHPPPASKPTP